MDVATLLANGFCPNPFYDKVDSLWSEENLDLCQRIIDSAEAYDKGVFGNDFSAEMLDALEAEFGDELDSIIDGFENVAEVPASVPPGPSADILYGRISSHVPVLDIGSGDGRKAEKAPIDNLVLSDLQKPVGNYSRQWWVVDANTESLDRAAKGRVLTSYMALSQFVDLCRVSQYDGMHVVPVTEELKEHGAVVDESGNVVSSFKDRVFVDRPHVYPNMHSLSYGYGGVTFLKERVYYVEWDPGAPFVKYKPPDLPPIGTSRFALGGPCSPKYDGIQLFFDLKPDGTGAIMNRAGKARQVKHNADDCQLIVEKCGEYYILLRVIMFNGFVPWHNLDFLVYFCQRVNFDIGGNKLCAPLDPSLSGVPTDGFIFRRKEVDYRVKTRYTVDLDEPTFLRFFSKLSALNVDFVMPDTGPAEGIVEYEIYDSSGTIHLRRLRNRRDKLNVTSLSTCLHYVTELV